MIVKVRAGHGEDWPDQIQPAPDQLRRVGGQLAVVVTCVLKHAYRLQSSIGNSSEFFKGRQVAIKRTKKAENSVSLLLIHVQYLLFYVFLKPFLPPVTNLKLDPGDPEPVVVGVLEVQ